MTREETVKNLLTELIDMIDNGSQRDLDRADEIGASIIKLFKQEHSEDAISRQAALDIVDGYSESQSNVEDVTQDIISDIAALPSVTPEPKTGHWIKNKGFDDRDMFYTCSECGRTINVICGDTLANYPYCHCGTKMVEPQESEG